MKKFAPDWREISAIEACTPPLSPCGREVGREGEREALAIPANREKLTLSPALSRQGRGGFRSNFLLRIDANQDSIFNRKMIFTAIFALLLGLNVASAATVPTGEQCTWKKVMVGTEAITLTDAFGSYTVLRAVYEWRWICQAPTT